jgi:integrase
MSSATKLSDTRIKSAKPEDKPVKLSDGSGLYLLINPNGSRLWRYRYRLCGKENVFAVGEYATAPNGETPEAKALRIAGGRLTLAEARDAQINARTLVRAGQHPAAVRAEARRLADLARDTTLEGVARQWLKRAGGKWKPETFRQRERLLEADIFPVIGKRPIAELRRIDLNSLIVKVEGRAPQMAILARQLLQAIFDHAEDTGAVAESIALRLAKVEVPTATHARQLAPTDIGQFLRDCEAYPGSFEIRAAMQLAWLTLARSMEVLESEWAEFDFEHGIWRIPAARMKMERDHIIPLSRQAIDLLQRISAVTGKGRYLFPNRANRNRPASHGGLWKMVDSIGWRDRFSPHGLRGTASTIMNESGRWSADVIERLLAHVEENKTRGSYNAAEYLGLRAEALQWWADLLDAKRDGKGGAEVHHLPKVRQIA